MADEVLLVEVVEEEEIVDGRCEFYIERIGDDACAADEELVFEWCICFVGEAGSIRLLFASVHDVFKFSRERNQGAICGTV